MLRGRTTGYVHLRVATTTHDASLAARALIQRSQWWLTSQGAQEVIVELPDTTMGLYQLMEAESLQPERAFVRFRSHW